MELKIFYSWQTTTSTKYNKNFINACINKAVKKLERKPEFKDVHFEVQEGVTGESGSVAVASRIVDERIPNCDIFITDLSVVNHISRIGKWLQGLFGEKYKPFQNNNVTYEYGVAYEALSVEKIIGVLNADYGSPKENPDNIPFDLSHLRFPIEYRYSKKTKQDDKEKMQQAFISDLASAIKVTAQFAMQNQQLKYRPFLVWSDWGKYVSTNQTFSSNGKIEEIMNIISETIKKPQESIRLLGLSGIGKTRILLEAFRGRPDDKTSIALSGRVLYIDLNLNPNVDLHTLISRIIENNDERIIVIDNCPKQKHRELLSTIHRDDSKIVLITIDSNPEEFEHDKISGVNYILIKKEDLRSVVEDILQEDFSALPKESLEKIKEFSQGIPLMAVLLGESIKNGEKFIGKLDDKELLDGLLGPMGRESRTRIILRSCSMFNYFGFEEELNSQLKFIATNKHITSLSGEEQVIINEFYETCNNYLKREIFEKRGRLLGMRPFPLAMSLAQEWLESCTRERLMNVIASIAEQNEIDSIKLSDALCEQMKFLGYDNKARLIIENIVGPSSPFDKAEVLNTELGSRLFRSFVEVNPVAVSENFYRNFGDKSEEELREVRKGRRNIIWVLEKLCFDKRTFDKGIRVLYSFAVAENETLANNATGQFLHLFSIFLSGTEANLEDRLSIIDWGLERSNPKYKVLAIEAMEAGLNSTHFGRIVGAEQQGGRWLRDYEPDNKEIEIYWKYLLARLSTLAKENSKFSELATKKIANAIRSICRVNFSHLIIPIIKEIAEYNSNDWDDALNELRFIKKYEKDILPEPLFDEILGLIEVLTKRDFVSRYVNTVNHQHLDSDEDYSSERVKEAIINLADEFIASDLNWEDIFPIFYKKYQIYSFYFGKRLFVLLMHDDDKVRFFINLSIKTISSIDREERDLSVLGGFVSDMAVDLRNQIYQQIKENDELSYILFYFLSIENPRSSSVDMVFELIDNGKCSVYDFLAFNYGDPFREYSIDNIKAFCHKLFIYGDDGYEVVFNLLFNYCYPDDEKKKKLSSIFKECILHLGIKQEVKQRLDRFNWYHIIMFILQDAKEAEFAKFINDSIIDSISPESSYHLDHDVQRLYEVLIQIHFDSVWPNISNALLSEEYIKFYELKHILGSRIGGIGRTFGVLFDGDIDVIFEWCEKNKPLAPKRLAELVPIFAENDTQCSEWHPITLRLIDTFGYIEDVLNSLSSNMGTFLWTGSMIPLLVSKKKLLDSLCNHKIEAVANWANRGIGYIEEEIKREKNREEEMYL